MTSLFDGQRPRHGVTARLSASRAALSLASLASIACLSACSSSAASGPGGGTDARDAASGTSTDAIADTSTDAPKPDLGDDARATDGGCVAAPVWGAGADTAVFSSSGGFSAPSPNCGPGFAFSFSAAAASLDVSRCQANAASRWSIALTTAEVTQIVAELQGLQTSCDASGCGADFPDETLLVKGTGASQSYSSDFYAGCPSASQPPPYVSYTALSGLSAAVEGIADADCGDGGTSRCTSLPADGGAPIDAASGD